MQFLGMVPYSPILNTLFKITFQKLEVPLNVGIKIRYEQL